MYNPLIDLQTDINVHTCARLYESSHDQGVTGQNISRIINLRKKCFLYKIRVFTINIKLYFDRRNFSGYIMTLNPTGVTVICSRFI